MGTLGQLMRREIMRTLSSHEKIRMLMELDATGGFREGVTDILGRRNRVGFELSRFGPLDQGEVADVHMACTLRWCTCRNHMEGSPVIDM